MNVVESLCQHKKTFFVQLNCSNICMKATCNVECPVIGDIQAVVEVIVRVVQWIPELGKGRGRLDYSISISHLALKFVYSST